MTIEYKQSLTELNTILNYMDIELIKKVPTKLLLFIRQNMDASYIPNISKNIPINEQPLKKDTKVLLSLIYRDYLVDNEKKEELIEEDLLEKQRQEEEKKEKYNPNNLFKNRNEQASNVSSAEVQENTTSLIEYKEQKWYQKIFARILRFFKR